MRAVALFTRAWIEIHTQISLPVIWVKSPSLRGRGLKSIGRFLRGGNGFVALFTRAWIEIFFGVDFKGCFDSRPLYEGVD